MRDTLQAIAIAEHLGWTRVEEYGLHARGIQPVTDFEMEIPDYLNDLNAMHVAEASLNNWQRSLFYGELANAFDRNADGSYRYGSNQCWETTHASAARRAEAFLRTVDKWAK